MTANYVLLEKITVGAANASSITFSGIPQTGYTDLVVKMSARGTHSVVFLNAVTTFNGSGGTAYSGLLLYGDGANAGFGGFSAAGQTTYGFTAGNQSTSNTFSNNEIYIPNYTSSNYKSALYDMAHETNATTAYTGNQSVLWANTAPITSITLAPTSGSFAQYSTFYLYGVAKLGTTPAIVPYATGGNTIMTDGTYWYHTFISSGTFTPVKAITCDYLVVAGGGGGGRHQGGGGGAGGLRSTVTATGGGGSLETALSLGTSAYTVTVGAGGNGSASENSGTSGSNSVFSTITSTGGGGGAKVAVSGLNGGSGGGAGGKDTAPALAGGTRTTSQGFAGGASALYGGGGGGGAGVAGANGDRTSARIAAAGGNGVAVSITGSSVTYAGGGGAGDLNGPYTGGTGGGGAGTYGGTAGSGTANLGGGGGGEGQNNGTSGNGGSGIVIVRYSV